MPESVPMPESVVSAARAAATLPAAAESCGTQAPSAPAAVRGPGALSRWETVRAVMRLELLFTWRLRDTAALLGPCALGALGAAVPGLRGWLGIFSPENLVYYLLGAVLVVGVDLWRPSRETQMRQLYGALPVSRLDVLAARYLLLVVGWAIMLLGTSAAVLLGGVASDDAVGLHLTFLIGLGVIVVVMPPLLVARGGTSSQPVLDLWGLAVCVIVTLPAVIGVVIAQEAMPRQVVLAWGSGLIAALSAVGLGASWQICCRVYLTQDH
ncbi:ABC-2 transporter permease [Actinomyces oris]|uniref:ABC-2 transporter permease n=1 Tax=Actinomyces oris TaxID=544580 RepID=A0A508BTW2_9ACTO|nr:ABC-2 transporter permease [Actinomyces oris]QQC39218.1 ABC-2 transporter permease [Actinomyces oris]TQD63038.1 hypothetical protein FK267_00025 [Actinomyces oris]